VVGFSIKHFARKAGGSGGCRIYKLPANIPPPPRKQILAVPENK